MPVKLVLFFLGALQLPAALVHSTLPEQGKFKISGGLLVHWTPHSRDRTRDAIEAFDRDGVRVVAVNVHKLMPASKVISIDDVALRRQKSIAIAAVTSNGDGQTRAWLLQLTWVGNLVSATALNAAQSIGWLDFDERGSVWGLTDYEGANVCRDTAFNGVPCSAGALILVFDAQGRIVKSLLKQSDLRDNLRETASTGEVTFGLTPDKVWFWQPSRHRMMITDHEGGGLQKISIPHARTWNLGGRTLLTPTGEVVQDIHSPAPDVRGFYVVDHHRIKKLSQPQPEYLVGLDNSELVFISQTKTAGEFQMTRIALAAELQRLGPP